MKQLRGTWLHRRIGDRLLDPHLWQPEREPIARGLAIGSFFSVLQIPFQSLPAVVVAIAMRANVPAALLGCWITNPFTGAFIVLLELQIGFWLMGMGSVFEALKDGSVWKLLKEAPVPFAVGALVFAPITAVVCYFGAGWCYDLAKKVIERSAARRRAARAAARKPAGDTRKFS